MKKLPNNCIDLIFTSPPYNFGLDYNKKEDASYWKLYFENLFKVFDECIRVLKYSGRFVVNIQPLFSDYIPSHHIITNYMINKKLIWKGEILWGKNNYNCLDKTMYEGSVATADKIKTGNPYCLFYLVTETYDISSDVDIQTSKIDDIYVLRKQIRTLYKRM